MNIIKQNDTILFQGDSITDSGRRDCADGLGSGYPAIIRGLLSMLQPGLNVKILNRGIGGDRTTELLVRWKEDCEDLHPDILSIKIGVNDVWRIRGEWCGQKYIGPAEYEKNYRILIDRALSSGVRQLVLCSPTTIENETDAEFRSLLDERAEIVKTLAMEYEAVYVPFREHQKELLKQKSGIMWTADGCHPSTPGHTALAYCWMKTLKLI